MIRKRRKIINGIEIVLMEKVAQTETTIRTTVPVNEDLRTYIDEQIIKLKDEQETVVTQTTQTLPTSILPTASTTVVTQEDLLSIVESTPEDGNYIIYDSSLGRLRWEQSPNVTTELLVTEIENSITRISTDGLETDHAKLNYVQLDFEDRLASKGIFWADPWASSLYEGFSIQMATDSSIYNLVNPLSGYNYGHVEQLAMRFTSGGDINTSGLKRGWVWTSVGPPSYGNGGYMPVMSLDRRGRMTLKSGITFEEYDGEGSFLSFSGAGGNTTPLSGYHNYVMKYNKIQHGMVLADSGDVVVPDLFVSGHDTWFGFDSSVIPPVDPITLNFGPSPGPFGSIALISGAGGGGLHFQISRPTRIGYGATDYPLSAGQYFCGSTDLADIIDGVAGGALSINDLLDVDTGGTTDGMSLVYCAASETWCGVTIAGGPGGGISPGDSTNLDALTCTTLHVTGTTDPSITADSADFRGSVSGLNLYVNPHGIDGTDSKLWFWATDGGGTGANITWDIGSKAFSVDADVDTGGFNVNMQLAAIQDLYVGTTHTGYGHVYIRNDSNVYVTGDITGNTIVATGGSMISVGSFTGTAGGGNALRVSNGSINAIQADGNIAADGNYYALGHGYINNGTGDDPPNFNEFGYVYFATAGTTTPSYTRDYEYLRCDTGGTGFEFSHDLYVNGTLKAVDQITGNSMSAQNSIVAGTLLQSQGDIYVNSTRTNVTFSNLYFHDGSSPSNDYLRLRQSDDTFELSSHVQALGNLSATSNFFINSDEGLVDSVIYFCGTAAQLRYDRSDTDFVFDKNLKTEGEFVSLGLFTAHSSFYTAEVGGKLNASDSISSDDSFWCDNNLVLNQAAVDGQLSRVWFGPAGAGDEWFGSKSGTSEFTASTTMEVQGKIRSQTIETKSITVPDPTTSEDIPMFYVTEDMYFIDAVSVVKGTGTPSVTYQIATGSSVASVSNIISNTTTNTTSGDIDSIAGESVESGNWVVFQTSATGGTSVDLIHVTLTYSGVA